jgi:small subunit ribosomal protein S6
MAASAPTYDLMLLLDPKADDAVRGKIRSDVRELIAAGGGTLSESKEYGRRPLAFEIGHDQEAEYDLVQFQGPRELLERLQRTLRITDGVVRFRIIKLRDGTPAAPDLSRPVPAPEASEPVSEPAAG